METLKTMSSLEIPTNRIFYNKKTEVFSAEILDFMFVGTYKKSVKISKIIDDIFASLTEIQLERNNISIIDFVSNTKVPETMKLKHLKLLKEKKKVPKKQEKKEEKPKEVLTLRDAMLEELDRLKELEPADEDIEELSSIADDLKYKEEVYEEELLYEEEEEVYMEEKALKKDEREREESRRMVSAPKAKKKERSFDSTPSPPPPGAPSGPPTAPAGGAPAKTTSPMAPPPPPAAGSALPPPKPMPERSLDIPEEPQPKVYEINMGLQYYSVMMQQRSYLFYVYFSHKELKIVDEEGKTVYKTTVTIVTRKEEPPVLDLKIEGDGFEVHPIFGKVEVKKDAVNPPVMIFSIMPTKSKKKMKKRESERRFLNVYIEFEDKVISHTILSIIVQPKYFRLELGPIHLNLSKRTAAIISFISVLIAGASLVYTLFSWDPTSSFINFVSGFAPGLGSIIFIVIFLITLFKEGIYPLKEKISAFLNFDQAGVLIK
ncbi:MAG: hypothetical protein ACFE9S_18025 [Candidatus Hermodarchaeota archaeon]